MLEKGCVQVYTGDGKGKTTMSIGLALRASGAGLRVYIGQFLKEGEYSEVQALHRLSGITVEQYGQKGFIINRSPCAEERQCARLGYERAVSAVTGGQYDVVILDEINVAVSLGLITPEEQLEIIRRKPPQVELVMTGRGACAQLIDAADLVSCVQEVKHYYRKGMGARRGIEF